MNYLIVVVLFLSMSLYGCAKDHSSSSNQKIPEITDPSKEIDDPKKELYKTKVELNLIGATSNQNLDFRYSSNFNTPLLLLGFVQKVYKPWESKPTGTLSFFVESFDSLNESNFEKCTSRNVFGLKSTVCAIKNCLRMPLNTEKISFAKCELNNLDAGIQYSIFANYSGDTEHSTSKSQDVYLQVNPLLFGELTLSASTVSAHLDEEVTFSATLNNFDTLPAGEIIFYREPSFSPFAQPICSQQINEKTATCTTNKLRLGENKISAVFFNENKNYLKLESNTVTVKIKVEF